MLCVLSNYRFPIPRKVIPQSKGGFCLLYTCSTKNFGGYLAAWLVPYSLFPPPGSSKFYILASNLTHFARKDEMGQSNVHFVECNLGNARIIQVSVEKKHNKPQCKPKSWRWGSKNRRIRRIRRIHRKTPAAVHWCISQMNPQHLRELAFFAPPSLILPYFARCVHIKIFYKCRIFHTLPNPILFS